MKPELEKKLAELQTRFNLLAAKLDLNQKKGEVVRLESQSSQPDFWQEHQKAEEFMKKLGRLKEEIETVKNLEEKINSLNQLLKTVDEKTEADLNFVQEELQALIRDLNQLEIKTFLSAPYDRANAILSIHAGQGGTEACDWVAMLQRMYLRYSQNQGWKTEVVEERPGEEAGFKKTTLFIKGNWAYGYLKGERGTHRLVRLSPFNANNLRQTSFALVEVMPMLKEEDEDIKINPSDLEIDFSRASGHGGQNINKVSTAVRLKHLPTGLVVECQTQRYQEQNRKIALQILKGKLWQLREEEKTRERQKIKGEHKIAGWGNQIRSYVLHPYKLVKDLRSGWESIDAFGVLDGKLENFIKAEILPS